jgi:hypothetical protein
MAEQKFLQLTSRSKFEAIFGSDLCSLFAILGLLLCLIATRADELPEIKDSEAVHYVGVGKKRRSSRFGRLRHDQPTRERIYQFRTRYPKQTFAGFISAGSNMATDQRIATLQGKIIGITGTVELHEGSRRSKSHRRVSAGTLSNRSSSPSKLRDSSGSGMALKATLKRDVVSTILSLWLASKSSAALTQPSKPDRMRATKPV